MVETTPLVELDRLREAVYLGGKKVFSWDYLKELTPFALAIWYLDDGTFCRPSGRTARPVDPRSVSRRWRQPTRTPPRSSCCRTPSG